MNDFPKLKAAFDNLTTNEKLEFIKKLSKQLENSNNLEHKKFLTNCIVSFNETAFNNLSMKNKKEFIKRFEQVIKNNNNEEYKKLLNACVESYNNTILDYLANRKVKLIQRVQKKPKRDIKVFTSIKPNSDENIKKSNNLKTQSGLQRDNFYNKKLSNDIFQGNEKNECTNSNRINELGSYNEFNDNDRIDELGSYNEFNEVENQNKIEEQEENNKAKRKKQILFGIPITAAILSAIFLILSSLSDINLRDCLVEGNWGRGGGTYLITTEKWENVEFTIYSFETDGSFYKAVSNYEKNVNYCNTDVFRGKYNVSYGELTLIFSNGDIETYEAKMFNNHLFLDNDVYDRYYKSIGY